MKIKFMALLMLTSIFGTLNSAEAGECDPREVFVSKEVAINSECNWESFIEQIETDCESMLQHAKRLRQNAGNSTSVPEEDKVLINQYFDLNLEIDEQPIDSMREKNFVDCNFSNDHLKGLRMLQEFNKKIKSLKESFSYSYSRGEQAQEIKKKNNNIFIYQMFCYINEHKELFTLFLSKENINSIEFYATSQIDWKMRDDIFAANDILQVNLIKFIEFTVGEYLNHYVSEIRSRQDERARQSERKSSYLKWTFGGAALASVGYSLFASFKGVLAQSAKPVLFFAAAGALTGACIHYFKKRTQ